MRYIQTVNGPIGEEQLGKTLMHEHCLTAEVGAYTQIQTDDKEYLAFLNSEVTPENRGRIFYHMHKHRANAQNQDEALSTREIAWFKEAGGGTIVDVTPPGIGRDVNAMKRISKATGVNIVASTGLYIEASHPERFYRMGKADLADFFLSEIREGIEGTDVKAGYIGEMGMSDDWTPREVLALRAAGVAARESGYAITVHQPIFRTWGERIIDILAEEGVAPDQIVLSHCDPTLFDLDYHLSILERGARIQIDEFQLEFPCTYGPYVKRWLPRDIERVRHIKKLCDMGYEDKLTVSMDMGAFKTVFRTYGGPGYAYLIGDFYEYFLFEGVTEAQMDKILNKNPRHLLAREM